MITKTKKYAVYSRKSRFTGKGESIENQAEMCRQYILTHYPGTEREHILIYEDEGYSGSHLNRPQFQKMMQAAKNGQLQGIICYRLDRISRNIGDFASLIEQLGDLNIAFVSIREQFDTSSPLGRAMMYIASVFSQLERETTAERIRDNMHELAKTGRWLGGVTPTGYRSTQLTNSVTLNGKPRKSYKLEPVPEESLIVKIIYAKFLEYNSLTKVETDLINHNIRTKNGKDYSRFTIRSILQNPVYMAADENAWHYFQKLNVEIHSPKDEFDASYGIMAYNKTNQKPGRANEIRDMQEWIVAVGRHTPTICSADWIRAQCLLEQNKSKSFRKPQNHTALLSGLLVCGHCGSFMRPKLSQRLNEKGERKFSYLCETKERSRMQKCQVINPNGNVLDDTLCREMILSEKDNTKFLCEIQKAKQHISEYQVPCDEQLTDLYKAVAQREAEINKLVAVLAKGTGPASQDYITKQIDQLHEKNKLAKQHIHDLEQTRNKQVYSKEEICSMKKQLINFQTCFAAMNIEQKRMILRAIIKRAVWDGENIHVYLTGSERTPNTYLHRIEPLGGDSK